MKLNRSFFNIGIQKQNIKQHGWLSIVYLLGLVFALPLQMLLISSNEERMHRTIEHLFQSEFTMQLFFIIALPILAGIVMFRYIQIKASVDMLHSLPVQRKSFYLNHLISGLAFLLIPVWVTAGFAAIIANSNSVFDKIAYYDIWNWILVMSVMTVFFFVFSVFVGMMTGMSTAQGILTFILLVLPPALFVLVTTNLDRFLHGFAQAYYSSENITSWSPITMLVELEFNDIPIQEIITYFVLAIVFGVAGYFLYKLRNLEHAAQAITLEPLKPIFKYGVTFCSMLVGAVYFQRFEHTGWDIFGYISGSLIGYVVAEIILQKTWRIWSRKMLLGFSTYAVSTLIIGFIVNADVLGYERTIPNEEKIDGVYFGQSIHKLTDEQLNKNIFSKNKNYIQDVRAFHEEMATMDTESKKEGSRQFQYIIAYKLENGRKLVREYNLSSDHSAKLSAVVESEPYKRTVFNLEELEKPLETIIISPNAPLQKRVTISNPEDLAEIRQILKYEISSLKMEDLIDNRKNWGHIEIKTEKEAIKKNDRSFHQPETIIPWKKTFDELEKWLKAHQHLEQVRIMAKDIKTIEIVHVPNGDNMSIYPDQVFRGEDNYGNSKAFTNPQVIEEVLYNYAEFGDSQYYVRFVTVNEEEFYGILSSEDVPEEVASKF